MTIQDDRTQMQMSDVEELARDMVGVHDPDDELWRGVEGFAMYALDAGYRKIKGWKASDERTWEHDSDDCDACKRILQEYQQAAQIAGEMVTFLRQIRDSPVVPAYFQQDARELLAKGFRISGS